MASKFLDAELILSCNEQWKELDEKWGAPVDLDTEDMEDVKPNLKKVISCLDLGKTTFNSSFILKKVRNKLTKQLSKTSMVEYNDFLQDLQQNIPEELQKKQFYYINGQILSAISVEDICDEIDDIFKSVEKLYFDDSEDESVPKAVHRSITYKNLSFDETFDSEKEKGDSDDVDKYIDEAFEQLNSTLASVANGRSDDTTKDSVTTLVKKFSVILNNHRLCNPRQRRQCSDRFKELAEFWRTKAPSTDE